MNRNLLRNLIDTEIGYYEDNLYRHIHLGGASEDSEVVKDHRKKIKELQKQKEELGL